MTIPSLSNKALSPTVIGTICRSHVPHFGNFSLKVFVLRHFFFRFFFCDISLRWNRHVNENTFVFFLSLFTIPGLLAVISLSVWIGLSLSMAPPLPSTTVLGLCSYRVFRYHVVSIFSSACRSVFCRVFQGIPFSSEVDVLMR